MGNRAWNSKGPEPKNCKNLAEALNLLRLSCKGGSCSIYEWFCRIHLVMIGLRFCSDGNQSWTCEAEDAMGNRAWNSKGPEPKNCKNLAEALNLLRLSCKGGSCSIYEWFCRIHLVMIGLRFCSDGNQSWTCEAEDAMGNRAWNSKGPEPKNCKNLAEALNLLRLSCKGGSCSIYEWFCRIHLVMIGLRFCSDGNQSWTCEAEDAMGNRAWNSKGPEPKNCKNLAEALNLLRLSCKGGSCSIYEWFCRIHLVMIGLRFCSDGNQSWTCEAEDAMGNRAWNSKGPEPKICKNLAQALNLLGLSCRGGSCSIYEWFCRIHLVMIGLRFCSDGNQSWTCEAEDAMGNKACNSRKSEAQILPRVCRFARFRNRFCFDSGSPETKPEVAKQGMPFQMDPGIAKSRSLKKELGQL